MKVKILKRNGMEMSFSVEGISPGFANALRRIMMVEVPTMAIEWVDFKKNDSALPDEIIANRLGQIPLTFDKKAYNLPSECKCEGKGCGRCKVELILKEKGPKMVYSGDLKSSAKDVKPVFDKIPIVELFDGEELQFEAIAQLGVGREHIKWQAAVVGYNYEGDKFVFNVESVCGLTPEEVVLSASEILEKKMKDFQKSLNKLKKD
ncbi:MAG: DNA-directed RNA polymerase subunit D [Candidatus Aenigmatarchaeota archaeon]